MNMNLKNPLWITNPDYAKKEFEKELRERLAILDMRQVQSDFVMKEKDVLKRILGEA